MKQIVEFLLTQKASILILNEYRNNDKGLYIRKKLLEKGYLFQQSTGAKSNVNSVLIASTIPCNFIIYPSEIVDFPEAIVKAEFEAFDVVGVYFPHKKKHSLFEFTMSRVLSEKPAVMAGDFNTGKNYIDQKGNSFWYTDQMEEFEEMGYTDAFRLVHGKSKEYSWFSHGGNGYRYDHTYVQKLLSGFVDDCYYEHSARESGLSDHSPMVLKLKG